MWAALFRLLLGEVDVSSAHASSFWYFALTNEAISRSTGDAPSSVLNTADIPWLMVQNLHKAVNVWPMYFGAWCAGSNASEVAKMSNLSPGMGKFGGYLIDGLGKKLARNLHEVSVLSKSLRLRSPTIARHSCPTLRVPDPASRLRPDPRGG